MMRNDIAFTFSGHKVMFSWLNADGQILRRLAGFRGGHQAGARQSRVQGGPLEVQRQFVVVMNPKRIRNLHFWFLVNLIQTDFLYAWFRFNCFQFLNTVGRRLSTTYYPFRGISGPILYLPTKSNQGNL